MIHFQEDMITLFEVVVLFQMIIPLKWNTMNNTELLTLVGEEEQLLRGRYLPKNHIITKKNKPKFDQQSIMNSVF